MTNKKCRIFTDAQKAEALRIVEQADKPVSQVAKELSISVSALHRWFRQAKVDYQWDSSGPLTSLDRKELVFLHRDLKRVEMEREFFKKGRDLLCQGDWDPYELIDAEKVNYSITLMCKVLRLARSGYYAWTHR